MRGHASNGIVQTGSLWRRLIGSCIFSLFVYFTEDVNRIFEYVNEQFED